MNGKTQVVLEPRVAENDREPGTIAEHRPKRHWWIWLLVIIVLGAGAYRLLHRAASPPVTNPGGKSGSQAVPVSVANVREGEIAVYLNGLGSVTAFNMVTVRSRVDGQLVRVAFQEGQFVRQGDLLAEIDPRPFEVQLSQAEAQLTEDQAQINNAKVDLARYQTLLEQDSIPKQQFDTQVAAVAQFEGAIKADQAQIESVRLQLTYCHITAPISGRIGLRLLDAGNMVHANDANGLLVIAQVQPISVLFSIPEDNLPPVLKKLRAGARLPVEVYDRSEKSKLATGYLLTLDNQIDPSTGTSRLKAVFKNEDGALFPNQFVNARLLLDTRKQSLIVPVAAIQRGPQGTYVYVVKADQTVEVRSVTPGTTEAGNVSIDSGLSANEKVVVDGMEKLQAGSKIRVPGTDKNASKQGPKA